MWVPLLAERIASRSDDREGLFWLALAREVAGDDEGRRVEAWEAMLESLGTINPADFTRSPPLPPRSTFDDAPYRAGWVARGLGIESWSRELFALALRPVEAVPADERDTTAWYNVACGYALMGRLEESMEALRRCFGSGRFDLAWARADPDLAPLRESSSHAAAFEALLEDFVEYESPAS